MGVFTVLEYQCCLADTNVVLILSSFRCELQIPPNVVNIHRRKPLLIPQLKKNSLISNKLKKSHKLKAMAF